MKNFGCTAIPRLGSRLSTFAGLLLLLISPLMVTGCSSGNSSGSNTGNSSQILAIQPVSQETPDWCWLASGQMIFQFFGIPAVNPNYQCGIIGVFEGPQSACFYNCAVCDFGGGSAQNVALMLQYYSAYATNGQAELAFQFAPNYLDFQDIQANINSNSPILAGINVGNPVMFGNSGHLVVIAGYQVQSGQDNVVVNDPFPYVAAGFPDPYLSAGAQALQPGQYSIGYENFVQSFAWNTTYYAFTLGPVSDVDKEKNTTHFGPDWRERFRKP
jgi:hypothetical protein